MDVIQEVEMSGESVTKYDKEKNDSLRPTPLQILHHVKINVDPDTPVSTIKNVVMSSKLQPSFTKVELRKAEKKLRKAFIEFHHQLRLLKSYSSDEVNKLMDKLEAAFIKHFANGDRSEGMKFLRPAGLLTGCFVALIAAIIVSVYAQNLIDHVAGAQYMKNIFPLYSLLGYIVLHMAMFGANTYFWRRLRVNYPFIFGFKQGTSLGFREVLLLASGLSVLTLAAVLAHLDLEMDPETEKFQLLTELLPLGLVAVVLLIAFCPFNIIYRSSRFFLIRSTFRCILAPLYRVTFVDFFLADQLTSQCLRRVFEERNSMQGLNGLKYLSTVVALVMRSMYDITRQNGNPSNFWRIMAAATSGITTIYSTYWDIVMDWGLLQKNTKNRWLRDKLLIPYKSVYVVAIVVNIILRLVWMQLVLDFNLPFLHRNAMVAVVAGLEILRRGIWNFFRLENEHFNNVENYRAFKSIPMPFYYEEDKNM